MLDNIMNYGVGGINIDECRVGNEEIKTQCGNKFPNLYGNYNEVIESFHNCRFPSNTILTYDETDFDEVCGGFPNTKSTPRTPTKGGTGGIGQATTFQRGSETSNFNDSGSASRYFYCAKASKKDRDEGLEEFKEYEVELIGQLPNGFVSSYGNIRNKPLPKRNTHPTVKPTELMQYLVRLVSPRNSIILDPFMGSGSTGKAVAYENNERNMDYKFIGIELDDTYMNIAKARILYADGNRILIETNEENNTEEVVAVKKLKQQRLF